MALETFFPALKEICKRLSHVDTAWAVTGSLGFVLQGMDVAVNDIDLQTDQKGAYQIAERFSGHMVRPVRFSSSERMQSHFGEFRIKGIKVEVMGGIQKRLPDGQWEAPVDIRPIRKKAPYRDLVIPVLSLVYEYEAYKKIGRPEKAELIRRHLEKTTSASKNSEAEAGHWKKDGFIKPCIY